MTDANYNYEEIKGLDIFTVMILNIHKKSFQPSKRISWHNNEERIFQTTSLSFFSDKIFSTLIFQGRLSVYFRK